MDALSWHKVKPAIPHLYFALVALFFSVSGESLSLLGLLIALPFLKQIVYPCKVANLFMAIVALVYSVVMCVSVVLTLVYQIGYIPTGLNFYLTLVFLLTNLLMTGWLFAEAKVTASDKVDTLSAAGSDFFENP